MQLLARGRSRARATNTPAATLRGAHAKRHEDAFAAWWARLHPTQPEPEREHRFAPPRRFRFDFAWVEQRVAVEIDGGTWVGGRHSHGKGYERDCEKSALAAANGWRVLHLTPGMLERDPAKWCGLVLAAIEVGR